MRSKENIEDQLLIYKKCLVDIINEREDEINNCQLLYKIDEIEENYYLDEMDNIIISLLDKIETLMWVLDNERCIYPKPRGLH